MNKSPAITYHLGNQLDIDEMIELYVASTLGERRPVEDRDCMLEMLAKANLVVTAWEGDLLVGIARSLTDFCYVAYLADLAVRGSHQRGGIGKELIRRTKTELGENATIVLLAAPDAEEYYSHIGMSQHPSAWMLKSGQTLRE